MLPDKHQLTRGIQPLGRIAMELAVADYTPTWQMKPGGLPKDNDPWEVVGPVAVSKSGLLDHLHVIQVMCRSAVKLHTQALSHCQTPRDPM